MNNDQDEITPESAVRSLITGSAPERTKELERIWQEFAPVFELSADKIGFKLEAGPYGLILFTSRTMTTMWLLAFAAQEAFKELGAISAIASYNGRFFPEFISGIGLHTFHDRVSMANEYSQKEVHHDFKWPDSVPHPLKGRPDGDQNAMAFDLLCIAGAQAFLHEVEHLKFKSKEHNLSPHNEELECDSNAARFILEKVADYGKQSGYDRTKVLSKRAMGIGLCMFFITAITPPNLWSGSDSHPSIKDRMINFFELLDIPDYDHFWSYFSSILIALSKNRGVNLGQFDVISPRQFTTELIDQTF